MSDLHRAWLCLGSNIDPASHLRQAVALLREHGEVPAISTAWESRAVGSAGPNFLNACVLLLTPLPPARLIEEIIRPIEARLGRTRSADRYAAREIDIDIVLYDEQPLRLDYWEQAFMLVPLAELLPGYRHPVTGKSLSQVAAGIRDTTWLVERPEVLAALRPDSGALSHP